ncbi:pancreatic lipase-related protein 2-like isoform X1 [Colias croceus]|uniref:pancreatic lipase-related protein 2-like isoform X1 n=2 Tax=Colias crocea TaxID=72248 RepID=UPI001E27C316|nr:pancreatic lipase-related protein 2-like isoform X1 [Colias croceus]
MKVFILLFSVAVYTVFAVPFENEKQYGRFIEIPGGDGQMHLVDLEAEPDVEFLNEIARNPANNQYFLYTRRNPRVSQTLTINNANSIRNSNFNANRPTIVIVHGWLSNRNTNPNPTVRNAYLDKSDVNVIVMDWRRLAMRDYVTAANGVPAVGRGLGQFLQFLNQVTGAPFTSMHLIGFSLGAHLVGNAGRQLGGRAARVTGLDPAGPLWTLSTNRLRASDGVYVEAIHTDGGTGGLGIGSRVADADFFPNGGRSQPGCATSLCNHNRAWELFASTVTRNHLEGRQCTSMTQVTYNTCRGSTLRMGNDDLNKRGSGIYRLDTARRYPF